MPKSPRGGSHQPELLPWSKRPTVPIEETIGWCSWPTGWTGRRWGPSAGESREQAEERSREAAEAGALLGAMVLRATRYMPYRVLEDQIRHDASARDLSFRILRATCNLFRVRLIGETSDNCRQAVESCWQSPLLYARLH